MKLRSMALGAVVLALVVFGGPPLMQDRLLYFPQRAGVEQLM